MVRALVQGGADFNVRANDGRIALMVACERGSTLSAGRLGRVSLESLDPLVAQRKI
jgi:hypothetical protein